MIPRSAASSSALLTAPALRADTFTETPVIASIMNSSATDLRYLFISSVNDENWGDDLLTNDPLADGWFYPIDTADFGNGCEFDIVAVDADSWQTVLGEMSLCEITGIRLNYGGAEVTAIST